MDVTWVGWVAAAAALLLVGGGLLTVRRRRRAAPAGAVTVASGRSAVREGLRATRERLSRQLDDVLGRSRPTEEVVPEVEEALIAADVGVATAHEILEGVRKRVGLRADRQTFRQALRAELEAILGCGPPPEIRERPWVILVTGVNGVGKTTTVGKLAALHAAEGRRVLLVAADTFRAAAIDQLAVWAERTGADLIRQDQGASAAAVVFDGMKAALARGVDVVLIDSAGRLHTRSNLMEELAKVRRVIGREITGAPQETLLVVDATTGQNAVAQGRTFAEAVGLTGLVVTKLDGTARGGVAVALRRELGLPLRYVGVGEGVEDIRPFDAAQFAAALVDDEDGGPETGPAGNP